MSLTHRPGSPGQHVGWESRQPGVYLAQVTNINDPENLGRVKCKLLSDDKTVGETDWCFVMTPLGGKDYGAFFHPNVKDLVVLAYIGAEIHRPMVLGCVWNKEIAAPYKLQKEKNDTYALKTPGKVEVLLSDEKDKQKITVTTPAGTVLSLDDGAKKVSISDKDKKNAVTMELSSGAITVQADKKLTLQAGKTKIQLDAQGNITIDADTKVQINAGTLSVKAKGQAEITANGNATLKATGPLTVQSSAITTVKGSLVKIN